MSRAYYIKDAARIRLLASPLRQAILDWIVSSGPATVAQLAERLSRPADRLYYHVRLLVRAGLLVEQQARGDRIEAVYDVPGRPMLLDYGDARDGRRAVTRVVDALMRNAQRDFRRAADDTTLRVKGARRELWSGRSEGLLGPDEIAAVNAHLTAAAEIMRNAVGSKTRKGRKAYQLTFSLSPVRIAGS